MKYIVFWEFCPEDTETAFKKFGENMADHEKNPGKYQEYLYPPHFMGQTNGFSIVEGTARALLEI